MKSFLYLLLALLSSSFFLVSASASSDDEIDSTPLNYSEREQLQEIFKRDPSTVLMKCKNERRFYDLVTTAQEEGTVMLEDLTDLFHAPESDFVDELETFLLKTLLIHKIYPNYERALQAAEREVDEAAIKRDFLLGCTVDGLILVEGMVSTLKRDWLDCSRAELVRKLKELDSDYSNHIFYDAIPQKILLKMFFDEFIPQVEKMSRMDRDDFASLSGQSRSAVDADLDSEIFQLKAQVRRNGFSELDSSSASSGVNWLIVLVVLGAVAIYLYTFISIHRQQQSSEL